MPASRYPAQPNPRSVWLRGEGDLRRELDGEEGCEAGPPTFQTLRTDVIVSPTAGAAGVALAWTARSEAARRHHRREVVTQGGAGGEVPIVVGCVALVFPAAAAVIVAESALASRK